MDSHTCERLLYIPAAWTHRPSVAVILFLECVCAGCASVSAILEKIMLATNMLCVEFASSRST